MTLSSEYVLSIQFHSVIQQCTDVSSGLNDLKEWYNVANSNPESCTGGHWIIFSPHVPILSHFKRTCFPFTLIWDSPLSTFWIKTYEKLSSLSFLLTKTCFFNTFLLWTCHQVKDHHNYYRFCHCCKIIMAPGYYIQQLTLIIHYVSISLIHSIIQNNSSVKEIQTYFLKATQFLVTLVHLLECKVLLLHPN